MSEFGIATRRCGWQKFRRLGPEAMRALLLIVSLSFAAPAFAQDAMSFDDSPQMLSGETANQSVTPDRPVIQTGGAAAEGPKYRVAKELDDKVREFASRGEFSKAIAVITEALRTDSGNAELFRLRA